MSNIVYRREKNTTKKRLLLGLVGIILLIISSSLIILYPFASKEKVNYFQGDYPILFNGIQEGNALLEDNIVYVPVHFLTEKIEDNLMYDEKSHSIIVTTKSSVLQIPENSLVYYINREPTSLSVPALKRSNGELYLALSPLLEYYEIQYTILPETKAIEIRKNGQETVEGTINAGDAHEEKLRLRTEAKLQSPYSAQVIDKEKIRIENAEEDFYLIRKENGIAGYIHQSLVDRGQTNVVTIPEIAEPVIPSIDGPIHLTWEAVYTKNPNPEKIPEMPGVNVVSPTWFELSGVEGTIKNLGSEEYINWATSRGYQVWGLFSNAFDPDLTHEALKHYETRQTIIQQLLEYSQMYQLDGINIDIENVREEDGPFVTQFVREAAPYFHHAGLIVSMDITFVTTGNWSAFYEREKLAETVDYLIVMAYDEHWGSSPKAGSVASLPWVEENLQRLLEEVPDEKLILGVPLYTRLWEEKATGEVSSKAMSMAAVKEWLTTNGVTPSYDEHSGQNYAELIEPATNTTYRIWLEDELSLTKRVELAHRYNLKGIASWSRSFADETAWLALSLESSPIAKK
ncbi:glycosyl hydrolase family 18 protein [Bacillus tuaregi]|uniref:glycosyl hydrolase family 18 protein n=1 Tax=Bacillus tuaregi TaxID=1816695 RepID=UPI0008F7EC01|nr:glycosyl hydrolase family 18 protein [Bacillus tuaregi]